MSKKNHFKFQKFISLMRDNDKFAAAGCICINEIHKSSLP